MSALPVEQAYRLADRAEEQRWLVTGLWSEQAVGIVGGNEKDLVMGRNRHSSLISRGSTPRELPITGRSFHSEFSHVRSSGSLFQRGGFPGLTDALACSRALRFVSRFARA